MKIESSTVNLSASHYASTRDETSETLRAWVGDQRPDFEAMGRAGQTAPPSSVSAISEAARHAVQSAQAIPVTQFVPANGAAASTSGAAQAIQDAADSVENDPMLNLIKMMVELMSGHKITLGAADLQRAVAAPDVPPQPQAAAPAPQQRAGFGVEYDRHEVHAETEQTGFQAQGVVRTADGKEIKFQLDLAMNRSYSTQSDVSARAGDGVKKDPLVINFGGTAAQLQSQRFSFDLDGDGKSESVPLLGGGSGFLAFDMNGNGKIDSGRELFGPQNGNGFADLARYDRDSNGWIDQNDPIFQQLSVWRPDAHGGGALETLQQHGVGALFLGSAATPFALKDGANNTLGAVRASGAYLREQGGAGTLQQIDLMV